MGIVNAGQMIVYDDIDPELRQVCEDVHPQPRPRRIPSGCCAGGKIPRQEKQTREQDLACANGRSRNVCRMLCHGITNSSKRTPKPCG